MNVNIKIDINCILPKYRKFLDSHNLSFCNVFYGGTGSGKSYFLAQNIVIRSLKIPGRRTLVLRKTRATMDNTVIREVKEAISRIGLTDIVNFNISKSTWTFPNGSTIIASGYDDPEKLKGTKFDDLWMEEITDFYSYADGTNDYQHIVERLRGADVKNPRIFVSFNPIRKTHWVRSEFFSEEDPHKAKDDSIMVCRSTYNDNLFYGEQAKNQFEKIKFKNPKRWTIVGEGDWGSLGKLIYENWEVVNELPEKFDEISFGLDFGFAHNMGLVKLGYKDGDVYVLKELYCPKLTAEQLANLIKANFTQSDWGRIQIVSDSARPEMISALNDYGIYSVACKKGAGSVLTGLDWLQDRRIFVHSSCIGVIAELEGYEWDVDKKTGITLPRPVKSRDDLMDAIRYGCEPFTVGSIEFC